MNDNMNDYIVNNMILNLNLMIRDHYAIDVTDKPRIYIYIYICIRKGNRERAVKNLAVLASEI